MTETNIGTYNDANEMAKTARQQAKSIRIEWKAQSETDESATDPGRKKNFTKAIIDINTAIRKLKEHVGAELPNSRDAEREIGDCYGVKGGTYRDWGKYDRARIAYDKGLPYEVTVNALGGQPNSYCLVQRLVTRILQNPAAFYRGELIAGIDVREELARAAETVTTQIGNEKSPGKRFGDAWAQADLALVLLLLGANADGAFEKNAASKAWNHLFFKLNPPQKKFVYDSTAAVVKLLINRLEPYLDNASLKQWMEILRRLS